MMNTFDTSEQFEKFSYLLNEKHEKYRIIFVCSKHKPSKRKHIISTFDPSTENARQYILRMIRRYYVDFEIFFPLEEESYNNIKLVSPMKESSSFDQKNINFQQFNYSWTKSKNIFEKRRRIQIINGKFQFYE